jgi:hypothetical protein
MQSNFGPADDTTVVTAWSSPTAADTLVFPVIDCSVVEAHVRIRCTVVSSVGPSLTWRVVVEGQSNTLPVSSTAPPRITTASLGSGLAWADTLGGSPLHVTGVNFGPLAQLLQVTVTLAQGPVSTTNCTLVVPDREVVCVLPPGTGPLLLVTVSVLTQSATLVPEGLAYAPPVLATVAPAAWGTDLGALSVTVTGSGFGPPSQSAGVRVVLVGYSGCGPNITMAATSVSVRSDNELVFVVQPPAMAHVVPVWRVVVDVSGQATSAVVTTLPPQGPTFTFDSAANATHYFLTLSGGHYGPAVSPSCPSDVVVRVDGVPCDQLVMIKVGVVRCGEVGCPGYAFNPRLQCIPPPSPILNAPCVVPCSYYARADSYFFSRPVLHVTVCPR